MEKPKKDESISHATLRKQDLIPAFLEALEKYNSPAYEQLMTQAFPPVPAYVQDEGDESAWWDSEDAINLLDNLFDALDAVSPEGCVFSCHEGNSSDFGFWEINEEFII